MKIKVKVEYDLKNDKLVKCDVDIKICNNVMAFLAENMPEHIAEIIKSARE